MNQMMNVLLERRSVRAFRHEQIGQDDLSNLLLAAQYAPSAMGLQARHMTVIQNKELISQIVKVAAKLRGREDDPNYTPFYHAPTVIVFSAPQDSKYGKEDISCAIMNLMTAAHALGLGTCYIASAVPALQQSQILEQLNLPCNYIPLASVAVGYSTEQPQPPKERRNDDINYIR